MLGSWRCKGGMVGFLGWVTHWMPAWIDAPSARSSSKEGRVSERASPKAQHINCHFWAGKRNEGTIQKGCPHWQERGFAQKKMQYVRLCKFRSRDQYESQKGERVQNTTSFADSSERDEWMDMRLEHEMSGSRSNVQHRYCLESLSKVEWARFDRSRNLGNVSSKVRAAQGITVRRCSQLPLYAETVYYYSLHHCVLARNKQFVAHGNSLHDHHRLNWTQGIYDGWL